MRADIRTLIKFCKTCQEAKKSSIRYGHLPPKQAETTPWNQVQVDCIGPYTVYQIVDNKKIKLRLRALTMIDPVTSWIEIAPIQEDNMSSDKISTLFYDYWQCRYPRPAIVICDNGSEFKKEFKRLCVEYDLDERPTTIKNPQANGIVERVHQVIGGDMLRAFNIDELSLDKEDPFGEILARVGWAIRSTYHTTLQASPGQLVFGRDMLLDIKHTAK